MANVALTISESKVNNNCKIMIMWHFSYLNLYFLFSFPNQTVKEDLKAFLSLTKLSVSTHLLLTSEINCSVSQCIYKHIGLTAKLSFTVQCFVFEEQQPECALTHTHTFFALYNYFDSAVNESCPKGPFRVSDMHEEWFSSHKLCRD